MGQLDYSFGHTDGPFNYCTTFVFCIICKVIFFWKEEFYSDKNSTKKYSVGIIDMIKLRNIYNTYTYIQLNTHIYM